MIRRVLLAWAVLLSLLAASTAPGQWVADEDGYLSSAGAPGFTHGKGNPGPKYWNGYKYVVVLTSDDNYDTNVDWAVSAYNRGVSFTMALQENTIGIPGRLTWVQADAVAALGIEIASTGREYHATCGLLQYDSLDSIRVAVGPEWIRNGLSADPGQIRSYHIDIGPMSYEAALAIRDSSYIGKRGIFYNLPELGFIGNDPTGCTDAYSFRWDVDRPLRWDEPSRLYSFVSYPGEYVGGNADDCIFGQSGVETAQERLDAIPGRIARALAWSAANGYAPVCPILHSGSVSNTMVQAYFDCLISRGDVWITTLGNMMQYYRDHHVPVAPPDHEPFAKLDGVVQADSLYWALVDPDTVWSCATDSLIFSNSSSHHTLGDYAESFTAGMIDGVVRLSPDPSLPYDTTAVLTADIGKLPISGTEDVAIIKFGDASVLWDLGIVSARLEWYNGSVISNTMPDAPANDQHFFCVVGVTVDEIADRASNDMCYDYPDTNDRGTSWGIDWQDYDWPTTFGDYVYPYGSLVVAAWTTHDVTDYIRYVAAHHLSSPTFLWTGNRYSTTTTNRVSGHHRSSTSERPCLIVEVCQ